MTSDQLSMFDDAPDDAPRLPARPAAPRIVRTPKHAVFLALQPGAEAASAIVASGRGIARDLAVGGVPLEAGRLHVSLFGIVDYDDVFPADVVQAASDGASRLRHAAIEVVFDRAAGFGRGGDTLVLTSASADVARALQGVWRALGTALADAGLRITDRKATPHMTLAYQCRAVAETPIAPLRWTARDLVLIDSHVGQHRHDVLARWTLDA